MSFGIFLITGMNYLMKESLNIIGDSIVWAGSGLYASLMIMNPRHHTILENHNMHDNAITYKNLTNYNKWVQEPNNSQYTFQQYLDTPDQVKSINITSGNNTNTSGRGGSILITAGRCNRSETYTTVSLKELFVSPVVADRPYKEDRTFSNISPEQIYCGLHNTVTEGGCIQCQHQV